MAVNPLLSTSLKFAQSKTRWFCGRTADEHRYIYTHTHTGKPGKAGKAGKFRQAAL